MTHHHWARRIRTKLSNLTFVQRMVLIPLVAAAGYLLVLGAVLGFGAGNLRRIERARDGLMPSLETSLGLASTLADLHHALDDASRIGEAANLKATDSIAGTFRAGLAAARSNAAVPQADLSVIEHRFADYYGRERAIAAGLLSGEPQATRRTALRAADASYSLLRATLLDRAGTDRQRLADAYARLESSTRTETWLIPAILGVFLLTLAGLVALTTRGTRRGFRQLEDAAFAIAQGELNGDFEFRSVQDIEALAKPFRAITDYIREIAGAADHLARGDRTFVVKPRSERDVLLRNLQRAVEERQKVEDALHRSEEQFRQAQKMEAVGRLAGGIAHDFNNLLTAIQGRVSLLGDAMAADDPGREDITEISEAVERAATLTQQLLAYSRKQLLRPQIVEPNRIIRALVQMTRPIIGEDVDIALHLHPALWNVRVDPTQFEQVLLNLLVNSRDAMPGGGRISIRTSNVELGDEYVQKRPLARPGPYVLVAVSDNGAGMTADVLERIFEPFYTTKEPGRGTGLGLSTAYGIVKQSDGDIWVYSEPGQGTTFKIYLPRVEAGVVERAPVAVAAPPVPAGDGTILVVEDSAPVRALVHKVLNRAGYTVLAAVDGEEAIRMAADWHRDIDLLVTDIVMPGRGGPELADDLLGARPEMRVLFMSGYAEDAIRGAGRIDSRHAFIEKPFNPGDLMVRVQQVLADQAAPVPVS